MKNIESMYYDINALLDHSFARIIEDVEHDLKKSEEYQDAIHCKNLLLDDYPFLKEIEKGKPVDITKERLEGFQHYVNQEQKLNKLMLKEMYYRGLKDSILLISRARIFDNDFNL